MEKERTFLKRIFEMEIPQKFNEEERIIVIDAFLQFSQNPTSMSAGYGIEKNYPLIRGNLKKRYKLVKSTTDTILDYLKKTSEEMLKINYDVYFWRHELADYIKDQYNETFSQWYENLYDQIEENQKPLTLFLLYTLSHTNAIGDIHRWYYCFFDKEEKLYQSIIEDLLVQWGLGNVLYYRSSKGREETRFIPFHLLDVLREKFREKIPISEKLIEDFFENLFISNIRLLEKCLRKYVPVLENREGRITQIAPLIVEKSKSYFAISPFALDTIKGLIKDKKGDLTKGWKIKFSNILNSFVRENYPYLDLKSIFEIEGAYCWEIRYVENLETAPINATILLSPYIFTTDQYSTIIDYMRQTSSSPLNLIFLLMETLPTIIDALSYITSQKYLIFLYDEKSQKFIVIEKGNLPEDISFSVDSFLSNFLPYLEKEIKISKTFPEHLEYYIENLRYFNQFPRLVSVRNRIFKTEPRLRESLRIELINKFSNQWKDKLTKINPTLVKTCKNRLQKRLDKEKAKDFLDGATLGELIYIVENFPNIFILEKNLVKGFLNIINQHRKVLEHPFKEPEEDFDEKTFRSFNAALDYIENVIC